jgi:hypothetical protein
VFEQEIRFLRAVEDPSDITNHRQLLDAQAIEKLRRTFPGISEEYLAYLREVGPGSVRECQYEIYGPDDVVENKDGRIFWVEKLLLIGHDFGGDDFALDAANDFRPVVRDHETGEVFSQGSFREFIRAQMLLGPEGNDQRGR